MIKLLIQDSNGQKWLVEPKKWCRTGWPLLVAKLLMTKANYKYEQSPELQEHSHESAHQVNNHATIASGILLLIESSPAGARWAAASVVMGICNGVGSALSRHKPGNVQELVLALKDCKWDWHTRLLWACRGQLITPCMWNWMVCDAVLLQKLGLLSGMERDWFFFSGEDMSIMVPLLVLGIWIQCMLCSPGQGIPLLVVSARWKNSLALYGVDADDRWHVLQEDGEEGGGTSWEG